MSRSRKTTKLMMAPPVKLPSELEEEILCWLPPQSLVRFRTVCKRWNALLEVKSFISNHLSHSRPHFIFLTSSKLYSIDIIGLDGVHPTTELRELALPDFPLGDVDLNLTSITAFDEFLFCTSSSVVKRTSLWNPWLRQVKWIDYDEEFYYPCGFGYDNSLPNKVYKIFGYFMCHREIENNYHHNYHQRVAIYECASHTFKFIDTPGNDWPVGGSILFHVSLNGNLYWLNNNPNTNEFFILTVDFSRDLFKPFCLVPCPTKNDSLDQLVLAVFEGNRFSLLKQCYVTRKIEIWVTEKKIGNGEVVWINFMTFQTTNLPNLFNKVYGISYFIYDKTLVMCCGDDETGAACIYIVRGDMFKKTQIASGFFQCCHCVYFPNFIPVALEFGSSHLQV